MVLIELDNGEITDEYILYNHNSMKQQIQTALDVIKEYIINNNLLIVGGTAIDYALKLKNNTLYNDLYQVPDFDIISPNNVEHANNIGEILCNLQYKDISIVPAIHHTTVRVQLLGFTLFDSTYVPDYIYNKIPYLEYKEFKFIDPTFQKINQYLSLSLLFKITGPSYNILNRFTKDVQRLDLLNNYYTITPINDLTNTNHLPFSIKYNLSNIDNIKILDNENKEHIFKSILNIKSKFIHKYHINNSISYSIQSNFIFHGTMAYHLVYSEFDRIYSKLYSLLPINNDDKNYIKHHYDNITIHKHYNIDNDKLIFDLYENTELCFINTNSINSKNNIKMFLDQLTTLYSVTKSKNMDNILDLLPKHINGSLKDNKNDFKFKIFDLYGDLLGINLIYINSIDKYLPISTYTYNLMYFLTNYFLEDDENIKNIYLHYYVSLYSIINIIQYMYYKYPDEYNKSEDFTNSCFNYSINISDSKNYPDNFHYYLLNFKNLVNNNKNLDLLPPKNYIGYPNCTIKNIFDKKKSHYYQETQQEITNLGISNITLHYDF
jgi:predicted nucleotidyltransferase